MESKELFAIMAIQETMKIQETWGIWLLAGGAFKLRQALFEASLTTCLS